MNFVKITGIFLFILLRCSLLICDDVDWSFPPYTLSSLSQNASDPQLAMDTNGNVVAVWMEDEWVTSASMLIDGMWSDAVTVSNSGASSPRIAIDANSNATVVWVENGFIKTATQPLNGNWSSPIILSTARASSPEIAVDPSGNIVVVWARDGGIESATKLINEDWPSSPDIISSDGGDFPQVAIGASRHVVAVWHAFINSKQRICSASKPVNGQWSTVEIISDPSHNSTRTQIAVDSNGNAIAVWYRYDSIDSIYSNVVVQAASQPANGNWTAPVDLSDPGIYNPFKLIAHVAFDGSGNAIAVWNQSFDGSTFSVESAIRLVNENWTQSVEIAALNLYALDVDLAVNSLGDAFISYMFYDKASSTICIQTTESDLTPYTKNKWPGSTIISKETNNAWPRITACFYGKTTNVVALWMSFDGTTNIIQSATGVDTFFYPPTDLSVTQKEKDWGVFKEYFNILSWQPSLYPDTDGYLIYRNGVLINTVDASTLQIIDHNRGKQESVTYGIAACEGISQSAIVYITFP